MPATNQALRDAILSHSIGVRRLSTGIVKDIVGLLNSADKDIVAQIEKLDPTSVATRYQRQRLDKLLGAVRAVNKDVYKRAGKSLRTDLIDLAEYETGYQANTVARLGFGAELALPTKQLLTAAVTAEPFQGRYLNEWVDGLEAGRFDRLRAAIRIGVVEGQGVGDIVNRVIGTKQLNYKDGVLDMSRRSATTLVRTAVTHTVEAAKDLTYQENEDILDGWRWVATLEPTTCMVCADLDGQTFPVGEGPDIPAHLNCRCTSVPIVKGAGKFDRITYAKWLAGQSAAVQDLALGPTRAELYREGGLSVSRFVDDLHRPLTLEQLKKVEPRAFKRAGVE